MEQKPKLKFDKFNILSKKYKVKINKMLQNKLLGYDNCRSLQSFANTSGLP